VTGDRGERSTELQWIALLLRCLPDTRLGLERRESIELLLNDLKPWAAPVGT
jgi:hypothetical protein